MTLSELIAKLEDAEEGSRGLDHEIAWCLYKQHNIVSPKVLPKFTTSLDAALPWENIVHSGRQGREGIWRATHWGPGPTQKGDLPLAISWHGEARTEPLARRIAALKAKEASDG